MAGGKDMENVPSGILDFNQIRDEGFRYIDKTPFIHQVLEHPSKVLVINRTRRFGKTLNI